MSQTYEITAKRVVINNVKKTRPQRSRALAEVVANRHGIGSIDLRREELDRGPQGVELGTDVEPGLARFRPTTAPDANLLGLQTGLDLLDDSARLHQTSSPSTAEHSPAPATVYTTPRVGEQAPTSAGASAAAAPASPAGAAAPRLFYQDRLVTLYHGDSLVAPELWLHADVLITDPPYGLQALAGSYGSTTSRNGSRTIANDLDTTVRDRVLELWGDKPAAVFGTPRLPEPPGGWTDRLVWDKAQLGLNGGAWRYAHESIFVRGDGWRRISNASSSILRHSSQSNRAHVNQHIHSKPEKLLADLIAAAPDGTIVDTFAGGGSTVAAAAALGRRIIAFELEEDHCQTIVDRLSARLDLGGLS